MTTATTIWQHGAQTAEGSVAATLRMTAAAWINAGATFVHVDDGDGDHPGLAVGKVELDGQPTSFAVLDYEDGETTFMVVAGDRDDRPSVTARIIEELLDAGVIPSREAVLEVVGLQQEASADDKLEYTLGAVNAQLAGLHAQWLQAIEQIQGEGLAKAPTPSKRSAVFGLARLPKLTSGLAGFRVGDLKIWMSRGEDLVKLSGPLARRNLGGELSFGDIRNLQSVRGEALVGHERLPISALAPAELLSGSALAADIPTRLAAFHPERGEAVVLVAAGETQWPILLTGLSSSWHDVAEVDLLLSVWRTEHGPSTSGQLILDLHAEDAFKQRPGLRRFRLVLAKPEKL